MRARENEQFTMAQDYGTPSYPGRMEAANVEGWDYGRGNPPNPIAGVVDISLRPNNATGFVFNTFIYVMFRGVSAIYVANRMWYHTGQKINENWFRYKVAVEDPL